MYPPGNFGFDPTQLAQQYQQYLPQQPAPPQPGPAQQALPPIQAPTQPAPPQRGPTSGLLPSQSPGAPSPIRPVSAPAAPTQRSPQQTIESWHRFIGTQGLQQTRPGFYGTGGMSLQDMVQRFNQNTGGSARIVGRDKVDFGFGPVDVLTNSAGGGANQEFWFNPSQVPGYVQPGGGGGGRPASGGGGGGAASLAGGTRGGGKNVDPALRDALLRLMQRSEPGAINPLTDPNLAPQANAYAAARERSARQARESAAERMAFQGLNPGGQGSGAFETTIAGIQERSGQDIASQQAGLVEQEVQARRQDLLNALQLANSIGARDMESQIRMQLANLDNTYRYAALNQNQSQFNDTYGLNRAQLESDLNRNALLAALGYGG